MRNAPAPTVAVSMNYVDATNRARALAAAAPAYHPRWLARLKVRGDALAGSRAPWYARQMVALPSDAAADLASAPAAAVVGEGGLVEIGALLG